MKTTPKGIENAALVEIIFGGWPSFHDAEIHGIAITRDGDSGPQMDVTIHHWKTTSDVDSKGLNVTINYTLTTIRFFNISDLILGGFNNQNVLWDLEISDIAKEGSNSSFAVSMPASYGCEASFTCGRIRVMSAASFS